MSHIVSYIMVLISVVYIVLQLLKPSFKEERVVPQTQPLV